jgi:hypothetical protein
MSQGTLAIKFEEERNTTGMTAVAGLTIYLELLHVLGIAESVDQNLTARQGGRGWTDRDMILALLLLNLTGGSCVDDLDTLEADDGLRRLLFKVETHGLSRQQRRALERRREKEGRRAFPSPSATRRYLLNYHDEEEEEKRSAQTAFIPETNHHLAELERVHTDLIAAIQARSPSSKATLDQDATLVESDKREALYSYKGFKSYQPLNVYWAEQDLLVRSEFRDGNVPANYNLLRVFQESLERLPEGVDSVYYRGDSASFVQELLRYCAEGKNERFGTVHFTISTRTSAAFRNKVRRVKDEDWKTVYCKLPDGRLKRTKQQYAEVGYVPHWASHQDAPTYRFLAIREFQSPQLALSELENDQLKLPFPTMNFKGLGCYKVTGIVSNRLEMPANDLILWHRERCGKSEEVHVVQKDDLAGGKMPSGYFGVNAAWWSIMVLAYNLNSAMKRLVLSRPEMPRPNGRKGRRGNWKYRRLKAIRFGLINIPGRMIQHGRQLIIKLVRGHPATKLLLEARRIIQGLVLPVT